MSAKHTPGPWVCNAAVDGYFAVFCDGDRELPVTKANSDVLAAAPELLAALELAASELAQTNENLINRISEGEAVTCWQEDVQKVLDATRAAIAKAKGGTLEN